MVYSKQEVDRSLERYGGAVQRLRTNPSSCDAIERVYDGSHDVWSRIWEIAGVQAIRGGIVRGYRERVKKFCRYSQQANRCLGKIGRDTKQIEFRTNLANTLLEEGANRVNEILDNALAQALKKRR